MPEWNYIQRLQDWERGERQNEIENKRQDLRDQREFERDLKRIEGAGTQRKKESPGCGCRAILVFLAGIAAVIAASLSRPVTAHGPDRGKVPLGASG